MGRPHAPSRSVYPAIDPQPLYAAQTYRGKVVLVTGASRGIGQEISLQYARAGAALAITARSEDALSETKRAILNAVPGAEVLVLVADVRDAQSVDRAVQMLLARFGKLDIVVANAGAISPISQSTCMPRFAVWCFHFFILLRQRFTRKTRRYGGIRLRSTFAGFSTSFGARHGRLGGLRLTLRCPIAPLLPRWSRVVGTT